MKEIVSIILPVYNEEKLIERTIYSLLRQETDDFDIEILVIDGASEDATCSIVKAISKIEKRVHYLLNEKRKTPYAFNLGISKALGQYVAILGAHCEYERNYIGTCLRELKAKGACGCSGKVVTAPANQSFQARLSAWIFSSKFGVSSYSFRTQPEGFVDSIPYPVYLKSNILEVGGYNEELHRNQDNLLSAELRKKGYMLYCTHKTHCKYFPKSTIKETLNYAYTNGYWVGFSIKNYFHSMSIRHLVPCGFFIFVNLGILSFFSNIVLNLYFLKVTNLIFFSIICIYFLLSFVQSIIIGWKNKTVESILLPPFFFAFHFLYGLGTINGFLNDEKGKK